MVHPAVWAGGLTGIIAALGLIATIARTVWRVAIEAQHNASLIEQAVRDIEALKSSDQQQAIVLAVMQALKKQEEQQAAEDTGHSPALRCEHDSVGT